MAKYEIAPTKSNLISIKRSLEFTKEGHELLQQKRDVLMAELMSVMDAARTAQEKVDAALKDAFEALESAKLTMGENRIREISLGVNLDSRVRLSFQKLMGVRLPLVQAEFMDNPPYYSPAETNFWIDEAIEKFKNVLNTLAEMARTRISLLRLAKEVRKTVRRVNALEKRYIPDYEESTKYIQDVLDEMDRESFFILKLIKSRLEKRNKAGEIYG